jgi:hypothetical protein
MKSAYIQKITGKINIEQSVAGKKKKKKKKTKRMN